MNVAEVEPEGTLVGTVAAALLLLDSVTVLCTTVPAAGAFNVTVAVEFADPPTTLVGFSENRTLGSSVKRCRDICRGGCSNRVTGHREVGRGCARRHGHASRNGCCCGVVARQSHGPLCRSARRGSIQRHFAGGIGEPARNAGRIQSNRGQLRRSEFATLVLHAKRRSIP